MNVLSLFSGAGGLDIGFHQAGFKIVACVELENIFCKTLAKNRDVGKYISNDCQIFNQDIATFKVGQLTTKQIDFVIGGPPCQTYSASGRRIGGAPGLDDERGRLFEHYCRIINEIKPKGFLFENVRGLLGVNNGEAWKVIVKAFSEIGYTLSYQLLDAAAYGVPQHRERVILVGTRDKAIFLFPHPLFGPDSSQKKAYITAGEVLADLQNVEEPYQEYDGKYGYLLSGIPEGMNYSFYTAELGHHNPVFAWRSKFSSFLYKVAQDKPVKTIQAQLGKFAGPFHWKNRRFTVAELKRLQSFPDDYEFMGSYNQVSEQIGNSVPPKLAGYLAQAVAKQIFDVQKYSNLELMPSHFKQTFDARKALAASKTRVTTSKVKTKQAANQMSFWDGEVSSITCGVTLNREPEKFVLSYFNPVKKSILEFEQVVQLLEVEKQKSEKHFFAVEVNSEKESSTTLKIKVRDLACPLESSPCWQLNLKLFNALNDGSSELEVEFSSFNPEFVYVVWDVAEEVIKKRSAYISLVALYGHFAEPKVKLAASFKYLQPSDSDFVRLIEFFSRFENCGRNLSADYIVQNSGVKSDRLALAIRQLRDVRYDIRSHQTTQRIPANHYFCAYPFPELSAPYQIAKPV